MLYIFSITLLAIDYVGKGGVKDWILVSQDGVIISLANAVVLPVPDWVLLHA